MDDERCFENLCDYQEPHKHGFACGSACYCKRRERYAVAIHEELFGCHHSETLGRTCADLADAAMAVADAENADYTVAAVIRKDLEAARDENARLRAELEALTNFFNEVYLDLQDRDDTIRRVRALAGDSDESWPRAIRDTLEGEQK